MIKTVFLIITILFLALALKFKPNNFNQNINVSPLSLPEPIEVIFQGKEITITNISTDTTLIQDSNGIWYSNDVVSATILIIPVENSPEIPGD